MKIDIRTVGAAALLAGAAVFIPSCSQPEQAPVEAIRPVVTMLVPEPGAGRVRRFSGTARAALQTPLSFRVGGEIIELPAKRGQPVAEGDLIARVDSRDYELQVKQSEAQLAQAEAQLEQVRANYERTRQLYETQSVSKSDLDSQEAAYKSAAAQRDSAQKGLELARQQLEYCALKAPVAGSIASVPVELHQTVAAGQTIADLSSGDEMELEVGIPESLIGEIKTGQPAEVSFEAIPNARFEGRISEVGIAGSGSSAYPVKVKLLKSDSRIRLGMVGEASFSFAAAGRPALYIPAEAVAPGAGGQRFVWVFNPATETVARREVKIGALTSEGLEISEGLKPGERIVTRGVNRVSEGLKVRLMNEGGR